MSRLYAVESATSNTGAKADHRVALRPGEVEAFARALAAALGVPGAAASALDPASPSRATTRASRFIDISSIRYLWWQPRCAH